MKRWELSTGLRNRNTELREFWQNARRTVTYGWRVDRRNMVGYGLAAAIQVASSLLGVYYGSRVINALVTYLGTNHGSRGTVFLNLGLSAAMLTIEQLAWRFMSYTQGSSLLIWHTALSPEFNGKITSLDMQRFEDSDYTKLLNKVTQDYNWKPGNFMYQCYNVTHGLLRTVSTAGVLIGFAPWLIPLLLLAVIPSLLVEQLQSKVKWDMWHVKGDSSRRYHKVTWMMQNKQDIGDMKLFGLRGYLTGYTRRMLSDFNNEQQKALKRFIGPAMLMRLLEGLLVTGVQLWLLFKVLARQGFSIGQYTFYSGVVLQFNSSVGTVLGSLSTALEYNRYMSDFYTFMDTPSVLPLPAEPARLSRKRVPEIRFEQVSFRYPSTKKYVFQGLDLVIKPGEHVALVGENGVGKSTLIKLLLRFYDVTEGRIMIDGNDLRDLDLDSWYRLIGVLFQDFSRYPFNIHDNIWMGRVYQKPDEDGIHRAAHLAGLDNIVKELPHGYETVLDNSFDEGVEPSGGQWQRVALARAFYRQAPLLILDEPTAAIDAKAEYDIFNNIFNEHSGHSAIIVSHRFSTVRKADRILVFEHGKIIEQGTHEKLMERKGLYHEMFTKQAEGYR
jgi:ATP-binding cassette, subfamily B, bacterial